MFVASNIAGVSYVYATLYCMVVSCKQIAAKCVEYPP